ncbi:MAG: hypothetical protein NVS4B12_11920 [Ktedonobacteraceae bacterium]
MSFTKDELQSFNTILEQKLAQQRRDLERGFDQRLHVFKRGIEQRLLFTQQELVRVLLYNLSEQYRKLKETLSQKIDAQQVHLTSTGVNDIELKQQLEAIVEHALDTQLISFDQLIREQFAPSDEFPASPSDVSPDFAEMELHTEIPLDDLAEAMNKALDERFSSLDDTLKVSMTNLERYLSIRLQDLRKEFVYNETQNHTVNEPTVQVQPFESTITSMQDVFTSIERLEHIIESMQVAMTSNHALLSNRIYHHQQLPLERAHPGSQDIPTPSSNIPKSQLPLSKE